MHTFNHLNIIGLIIWQQPNWTQKDWKSVSLTKLNVFDHETWGMQNSIKFFLLFFKLFHLSTRYYIVPSKLFYVTYLWNSFTNVKVFIMSDLWISCDSVVHGRRHTVSFSRSFWWLLLSNAFEKSSKTRSVWLPTKEFLMRSSMRVTIWVSMLILINREMNDKICIKV